MNLINKLPLMALVLGLGFIVMGMSSFKGEDANLTSSRWAFVTGLGYINIDEPLPPTGIPGTKYQYSCDGLNDVCYNEYLNDTTPYSENPESVVGAPGKFTLTVIPE